jgi:hypothetical protein
MARLFDPGLMPRSVGVAAMARVPEITTLDELEPVPARLRGLEPAYRCADAQEGPRAFREGRATRWLGR